MKTSAMLIVTDGRRVLASHPTGNGDWWEPQKGLIEPGEDGVEAAIRECREETSLDFSHYKSKVESLGIHDYRIGRKNIDAYRLKISAGEMDHIGELIKSGKVVCTSMVSPGYPENDAFEIMDYNELVNRCDPAMKAILIQVKHL